MEEFNCYNDDLEISCAINKAIEIFLIIKNTILKFNNHIVSFEDKKYLSLLLGIKYTNNSVSVILNRLHYDYGIEIHTQVINKDQEREVYNEHFKNLVFDLSSQQNIEELMFKLLNVPFVLKLHNYYGYPVNKLRIAIKDKSNSKILIKSLQR